MHTGLKNNQDLKSLMFCFTCLTMYAYYWTYFSNHFIFMILCLQTFQMSVIVHNSAHVHPFKDKVYNKIFLVFLTLLSGSPCSLYVPGHNESHHKFLETETDMMRTTRMKYRSEFFNLILFVPTVLPDIIRNERRFMTEKLVKKSPLYFQYVLEFVIYHTFLFILFYMNWRKALIVYMIPTFVGKFMIISLNMLQHYKCDPHSKFNHSRNFTGPILNFLFLNNGYHTIHHNAPGCHWSLLPKKHDEIKHHIDPNLIHSNILLYVFKAHIAGNLPQIQ